MKTIIAGTRTFNNPDVLSEIMGTVQWEITEIVSGTARGADQLGESWATAQNIPVKQFPADWHLHGRSAGYIRNDQMAKYADCLVAFWDGESRGTKHMIDLAENHNLRRIVVYVNPDDPTDYNIEDEVGNREETEAEWCARTGEKTTEDYLDEGCSWKAIP